MLEQGALPSEAGTSSPMLRRLECSYTPLQVKVVLFSGTGTAIALNKPCDANDGLLLRTKHIVRWALRPLAPHTRHQLAVLDVLAISAAVNRNLTRYDERVSASGRTARTPR